MSEPAGYRLSPTQRRIWLRGGDSATAGGRVHAQARLEGELAPAALAAALGRVVARHEALRTVFATIPGLTLPLQVVREAAPLALVHHDLTGLGPEEQGRRLEALARAAREAALAAAAGPLVRFELLALGARSHALVVVASALCADEQSLENLLAEVIAELTPEGLPDGGEVVQYADASEVLHEILQSPETEPGRRRWREIRLPEQRATLPLSALAESAGAGGIESIAVTVASAAIEELARRCEASAAAALLAAWYIVLARLTAAPPVLGLACAGRAYEGLDRAIGAYERHVPLAVAVAADVSVAGLVAALERALIEARELQDDWEPHGGAAGEPPWPAFGYSFRDSGLPGGFGAGGLAAQLTALGGGAERYQVGLRAVRRPDRWEVTLEHDAAAISAADAARLADQVAAVVLRAAASPEQAIGAVSVLGEGERRQVVLDFNRTERPFGGERCVHELIEAQARLAPERPAVRAQGQVLSYAALDARANRLAAALAAAGVQPETRVGLLVERSVGAMVAILGVLKAGCAYVPLDPLHPEERLAFMAADAGLGALVLHPGLRCARPPGLGIPTIVLDDGADGDGAEMASLPSARPRVSPRQLAYVLYTSGSTGRPKGVMIEHRSLVNLSAALDVAVYGGARTPLRIGLNASLSFDASVKQWLVLALGHTLCIPSEEVRSHPEKLAAFAREEGLDGLDCTPSQLRALLDRGAFAEADGAPGLLLVGGEPIDPALWRRFAGRSRPRLINVYGPTECTVDATACAVDAAPEQPLIGGPLANVRTYVLDDRGEPAPIGVVGELCIGGAGVGRGYFGQAALTAARFVPDPFAPEAAGGGRLYRTGDVARWHVSGRLELLGRRDDQVKLRGVRIELGEIEAALAAHSSVARAVVTLHRTAAGEAHLYGYFVRVAAAVDPHAATATPELVELLRAHLRARLPEQMVPSRLVAIERVPLSVSGKVDRAALPLPGDESAAAAAGELPRTEIERVIAAIWQEVLKLPRVGLHQNFFDLGGHSLLLAQVFDRLRSRYGQGLTMVELLRHPTVSAMAERIGSAAAAAEPLDQVGERARKQLEARRRKARGGRG